MTTFRSEEALAGLIALGAVPWVVWILRRGIRESRLPIGKSEIKRGERPGAFATLFLLYGAAALAMAFIGLDLLVGIRAR